MKNQKGLSLVHVLIFSSILSVIALIMTKAVTDLKMGQKDVETKSLLESLSDNILTTLQNSENCSATYLHNVSAGAKQIRLANGEVVVQEGATYLNETIRVDSITTVANSSSAATPGSLSIKFSKLKNDQEIKTRYGSKDLRKTYPINFVWSGASFKSCYLDEERYNSLTVKEFCESLGSFMQWDLASARCILNPHSCANQPGTVFAGIDSFGQEKCLTITEAVSMNKLFDTEAVNCAGRTQLSLKIANGKIQINCN